MRMTKNQANDLYAKLRPFLLWCPWPGGGMRWAPLSAPLCKNLCVRQQGADRPSSDQFLTHYGIEVV